MIRSFIAIDIEKYELLDRISTFQSALCDTGADVKIVKPENIHVTLKFLSDVPSARIVKISNTIKTLHFNPFDVSLYGVSVFPSEKRINVVWLGITKGICNFMSLHRQIESKLQTLGIGPDNRSFHPHVTIARMRSARNKSSVIQAVLAMKDYEFGTFSVNSVKLKQSVLTPQGPIYTTLLDINAMAKSVEPMDEHSQFENFNKEIL